MKLELQPPLVFSQYRGVSLKVFAEVLLLGGVLLSRPIMPWHVP
jgi:hypothetical protein